MPDTIALAVSLLALLAALLAVVLATVANRRWARRSHRVTVPGAADQRQPGAPAGSSAPPASARGAEDLVVLRDQLARLREGLDRLGAHVTALGGDLAAVGERVAALDAHPPGPSPQVDATALRHVAVVRYDAFADVGGRLSYSVAILDDTASGLVLTTLAGKADVRTYVRAISAGSADGSLTAEEQQAIEAAVGSRQ